MRAATPPTLETARLRLRPIQVSDFPAYAEMWCKMPGGGEAGGLPSIDREAAWTKFIRGFGFWEAMGRGPLAIVDRSTDTYLGDVGVADFGRDVEPRHDHMPEFGWALSPAARGRGIATEAVARMLEWADDALAEMTFCCLIDEKNTPSVRVADKCGFRKAYEVDYKGAKCRVFTRARRQRS